ncbi:ATP-binding protein [Corynebacterium evansiae]|uniref:ATP-binding protein n=1 Tax=Corynebacterium evansiae TaxID=2913499 RepID=UPI003EB88501
MTNSKPPQLDSNTEIEKTIHLPPAETIQHALGANHDFCSGIDELVDNAIDAKANNVCIVLHVDKSRLTRVAIHDDGIGMSSTKMERVLRLGGHEAGSDSTIGIYGMGMKEGSYANADTVTVLSRQRGRFATGIRLQKESFTAGVLSQRSITALWNLRERIVELKRGTTILWDELIGAYQGADEKEAATFLSNTIEKLRKHLGIRYHRFLDTQQIRIRVFTNYDSETLVETPAVTAIDPCGYPRSADPKYPRRLTVDGKEQGLGITAHIWVNRSKLDAFQLEEKDELGHQGFFVYIADRLITQGGWCGFQEPRKDFKLLRVVIDDPRVVKKYITISPQKASVRLSEDFHRFIDSLRFVDDPTKSFDEVCTDAIAALRLSNKKSGKANPIAEGGQGLAPAVKDAIESEARIKTSEPVSVVWGDVYSDEFVEVDPTKSIIRVNKRYRKMLNPGRGTFNDAPLVKTLLYLLFNDAASSKRTAKSKANTALWSKLLTVAADEQLRQQERKSS